MFEMLRRKWKRFATNSDAFEPGHPEYRRVFLINSFLASMSFAFFLFSMLDVMLFDRPLIAADNGLGAFLSIATLFYFHRGRCRVQTAAVLTVLIETSVLAVLIVSLGFRHYALYWVSVIPVSCYFLLGRRQGRLFSISVFLSLSIFLVLRFPSWQSAGFSLESLANVAFSLLALTLFVEYYELTRHEASVTLRHKNVELEKLSVTDKLTGIYNRIKLDDMLSYELLNAARYDRSFSVIMGDIDHFKTVNDRFGHVAGDAVLREIGALIKNACRRIDTPGRWGGEEFLIICPETKLAGAFELAERVRKLIAKQDFSFGDCVTISFGVSEYRRETTRCRSSIGPMRLCTKQKNADAIASKVERVFRMRKVFIASLFAVISGVCFCQDAPAPHSKDEIIARWGQCRPLFRDWDTMETYANLNEPFVIGKPKAAYLRDGLNMFNFIRFLAGLPDDLVVDEDLNDKAQSLTAINAMNGFSSHTPQRPEGMPKAIFDVGYAIGQKSNLQYSITEGKSADRYRLSEEPRWGPYPDLARRRQYLLARMELDLVADSDYRNVYKVQHRRNMFRPQIKKTGFGTIDWYWEEDLPKDEKAEFAAARGLSPDEPMYAYYFAQYQSCHVGDSSRTQPVDYDYVAWPSRGYFPMQFFNYGRSVYPWSITLNPAKYKVVDPSAITVDIVGPDGRHILFDKKDKLANAGMIGDDDVDKNDKLKKFLYFLPATASWQPSILFFPGEDTIPEVKTGDRYRVTIKGVSDAKGGSAPISYWIEFFSLPAAEWIENSLVDD